MFRHAVRPLLVAATTALGALPAIAQWYDGGYGPYRYNSPPPISPYNGGPVARVRPLPPFEIVDRLEDQGYDDVGRPRFDGSVYVVEATAPGDRPVRLVVDAFAGRVIQRVALGGRDFPPPEMGSPEDLRSRGPVGRPDLRSAPRYEPELEPEPSLPRQAARPDVRERAEPVDPRLAPDRREVSRPAPAPREAARSEPPARADRPYGVNPEGSSARRAPAGEAAKPRSPAPPRAAPAESPSAPAPTVGRPSPAPVAGATTAERPNRPVRVIDGVTPMNPDRSPSTRIEVPKPPDVAPPVGGLE